MAYKLTDVITEDTGQEFDPALVKKVNRFIKMGLRNAFMAGFDASAQGFNGEFNPFVDDDDKYEELRPGFEKWYRKVVAETARYVGLF
jgi:hypothetical protein